MREPRLGDDIDDFCVRCKRIMNHAVVSVINGEAAKVRCRTCHSDHDYRHEQAPPPKVDARKAALFHEVLKKVNPEAAAADPADLLEAENIDLAAEPPGTEADAAAASAPSDAPSVVKPQRSLPEKTRGKARK
jgi:hypothetical protein